MTLLRNKVAIITGASSGIGRAAAKLFASEGASVVLGARRGHELDGVLEEITRAGGRGCTLAGDVGDQAYAEALVEAALARFGKLDVAFNNAGATGPLASAVELSLASFEETLRLNLTSAFLAAKHQLPAMERGGSLIFTSTFVGYSVGMPNMAAYAAGKAGLIGLTKVLAAEHGARGIRVNALLPGGTDTPGAREFTENPESRAFVEGLHTLKRLAAPEEIAQAALYLASDMSSFTTGSALLADGGVSMQRT